MKTPNPYTVGPKIVEEMFRDNQSLPLSAVELALSLAVADIPRMRDIFLHCFQRMSGEDRASIRERFNIPSSLLNILDDPVDIQPLFVTEDPTVPFEERLEQEKRRMIHLVNRAIGDVRRRYITDIPGQEMLYIRKEEEARRFLDDLNPDPEHYPLVMAEVGITGETAFQVATIYVMMGRELINTAAPLETLRLSTVLAIETAETFEAVEAAWAGFNAMMTPAPEPVSEPELEPQD